MCQLDQRSSNSNTYKESSSPRSAISGMTFNPVVIPDEPREFDVTKCVYPEEYETHFESLMITEEEIAAQVKSLAKQLSEDFAGKRPVMLCVLKGATPFYQHLLDALQELRQGFTTEFIRVSSYEGTESTGEVQVGGGVEFENLTGKDVVIVEDIVDTGTTLSHLIPVLQEKAKPRSMQVITLLSKRLEQPAKITAKYVGFSIPNHFIVGYGLDYNELYRDTKDIFIISQTGIDFDATTLN